MKKCYCPKCDGELINLSLEKYIDNFWCDNCNIDITITYEEEEEDE